MRIYHESNYDHEIEYFIFKNDLKIFDGGHLLVDGNINYGLLTSFKFPPNQDTSRSQIKYIGLGIPSDEEEFKPKGLDQPYFI